MKISIIIPTYNGERYLRETLDSVMAQTFRDYEVFVIDDGSTSSEPERICRDYPAVKYRRKVNGGVSSARNEILPLCSGELIAFLDDDDVWLPTKLEKQVALYDALVARGIEPGVIYTGHEMIDDDGASQGTLIITGEGMLFETLFFGNFIGTPSSAIVPRRVIKSEGLRFDTSLKTSEDWDFFLGVARRHPIHSVNEVLTKYRNRKGSLTKNVGVANDCDRRLLEKHLDKGRAEISPGHPRRVERYLRESAARRYRDAAYAALFGSGDTTGYREGMRHALHEYAGVVTPAACVYYLLSFFGAGVCRAAKRRFAAGSEPPHPRPPRTIAVTDPDYRHMGIAIHRI